jgi:hypothetical protein
MPKTTAWRQQQLEFISISSGENVIICLMEILMLESLFGGNMSDGNGITEALSRTKMALRRYSLNENKECLQLFAVGFPLLLRSFHFFYVRGRKKDVKF